MLTLNRLSLKMYKGFEHEKMTEKVNCQTFRRNKININALYFEARKFALVLKVKVLNLKMGSAFLYEQNFLAF